MAKPRGVEIEQISGEGGWGKLSQGNLINYWSDSKLDILAFTFDTHHKARGVLQVSAHTLVSLGPQQSVPSLLRFPVRCTAPDLQHRGLYHRTERWFSEVRLPPAHRPRAGPLFLWLEVEAVLTPSRNSSLLASLWLTLAVGGQVSDSTAELFRFFIFSVTKSFEQCLEISTVSTFHD